MYMYLRNHCDHFTGVLVRRHVIVRLFDLMPVPYSVQDDLQGIVTRVTTHTSE